MVFYDDPDAMYDEWVDDEERRRVEGPELEDLPDPVPPDDEWGWGGESSPVLPDYESAPVGASWTREGVDGGN